MLISRKDFGEHQSCTLTIKCPGTYKLKEDISFNPKNNVSAAIVIDSDNVILDLHGKVLKQSSRNKKTQVTGIVVKTGHKNVTILGSYGVVKNFSQRGIYVEGGNSLLTLGDETRLTISGCGYGTPFAMLDGETSILQGGLQLGDSVFFAWNNTGSYHGILENVKVINCSIVKNSVGVCLGEGNNYIFRDCQMNENMDYRLVNPRFTEPNLGSFFKENSVINYGLCYFSNPELPVKPGIPVSSGISNIQFQNCSFNLNFADGSKPTNGIPPKGAYCDGLVMTVNHRNLQIQNCQFNDNKTFFGDNTKGTYSQTRGCVLGSGRNTLIENTVFSGNDGGYEVNGFSQSGLISAENPQKLGRNNFPAVGTVIRNCIASNNTANKPTFKPQAKLTQAFVAGFKIQYPAGTLLENCTAESNRVDLTNYVKTTTDIIYTFAHGIFLFSSPLFCNKFTNNVQVNNCKLSRNRIILPAPEEGKKYPEGYEGNSSGLRVLDDLCENIVIKNCSVSDNKPAFCETVPNPDEVFSAGIDLFNELASGLEGVKTGPSYVLIHDNDIQSNGTWGVYTNLDNTNIKGNTILNHTNGVFMTGNWWSSVTDNTLLSNYWAIVDHLQDPPTSNLVAGNKGFNNVVFLTGNAAPVNEGTTEAYHFPPNILAFDWGNTSINPIPVPRPVYWCCECDTGDLHAPPCGQQESEMKAKSVAKNHRAQAKGGYPHLTLEQLKAISQKRK